MHSNPNDQVNQPSVKLLSGAELTAAVNQASADVNASILIGDLANREYTRQDLNPQGAQITIPDRNLTYFFVSIPFRSFDGQTARLVWDNAGAQPKTGFGLHTRENDVLTSIAIFEPVNGASKHTFNIFRRNSTLLDLTDSNGQLIRHLQLNAPPSSSRTLKIEPKRAPQDIQPGCQDCQDVIDIVYGVVACSVWGYFLCDGACTGLTGGQLAICSIVCGIAVAFVCYVQGDVLKFLVCQPWCG